MYSRQLFNLPRRGFASLYNYSNAANPRVYLTVARGEQKVGDLVFELYQEEAPASTESFRALCAGAEGQSYAGSSFHQGMSGFGISGGRMGEENLGAFGVRLQDENTLRHFKRGQLTAPNDGEENLGAFGVRLQDEN